MPNYGDPEYWEDRYQNAEGATFDWLEDYRTLKELFSTLDLSKKTSKIINLGCGNSELCEEMYDDGYQNILNVDISKNVIDLMEKRNTKRPLMKFEQMDIRKMPIESNSYDLAIDKSTIDALLCSNDSFVNVAQMINEVQRIIKVNGYYMIISYGAPENRMLHLERDFLNFDINLYTIKKINIENENCEKIHYVYLCKKLANADVLSGKFFLSTIIQLENEEKIEQETYQKFNAHLYANNNNTSKDEEPTDDNDDYDNSNIIKIEPFL